MAAKKKGPGKGRGPATRPPSPAKRTTIPKQAAPKPPAPTGSKAASGPQPPTQPAKPGTQPPKGTTQSTRAEGHSAPPATGAGAPPGSGATAKASSDKGSPTSVTGASDKSPSGKPAAGKPAPGKPTPGKPTPGKPAPGKPAPGKPALGKPTPGKPAQGKPAPGKPTPGKPAPGKPAAGKPGATAPTAKGRPRGGPTREERIAAAAAARRRQSIRNKALVAAGVVGVLLVVGFVLISDRRARSEQAASFQTDSCTFDRDSDGDAGPGRNHVPNPTYDVNPPAGGDHTVEAAGAGIFTAERLPLDGQIVHAMEHGFIVFWHRPDLDEQSLAAFRGVAQKHPGEVLMAPRATLDTPLAATAWHVRLLCGAVEVDTLERFISTFVDKGPEKGHVRRAEA